MKFYMPYPLSHMMEYSARVGEFDKSNATAKYKPTQSQKLKNKKKKSRRNK